MERSVSVSVVGVLGLTLTPLSSGMTDGSPLKPRLTPGKHTLVKQQHETGGKSPGDASKGLLTFCIINRAVGTGPVSPLN